MPIKVLRLTDRVKAWTARQGSRFPRPVRAMSTLNQSSALPLTAKSTEVGEMLPAMAGVAIWSYFLIGHGLTAGVEMIWLLLVAVSLGAWALLMRLRFGAGKLVYTVGPWRRRVDLDCLATISWRTTGGGLSRGTILVQDRRGGRVPIYVGRYARIEEWGPLLLDAAERSGAIVDKQSRRLLEGAGAPRTLHRP